MADLTLVLVPGLLCDGDVWADQVAALEPDVRCVIADHGSRDDLGEMADAILAAAPDRFAIAGHSMGGRVAMEVVRRAPERLLGVALLDTGVHPRADGEAGEREAAGRYALLATARGEGMRPMAHEWLQNMVHPDRLGDDDLIERILTMMTRKTPDTFEAQIRALLARPDARPLLPMITVPALVLTGEQDTWSDPAQHRAIAADIPGSMLVIVPEAGHMSTMERPEAVTAALRDWLTVIGA